MLTPFPPVARACTVRLLALRVPPVPTLTSAQPAVALPPAPVEPVPPRASDWTITVPALSAPSAKISEERPSELPFALPPDEPLPPKALVVIATVLVKLATPPWATSMSAKPPPASPPIPALLVPLPPLPPVPRAFPE